MRKSLCGQQFFFCLQGNHTFRQYPRAKKCNEPGCTNTHSVLLRGVERVYLCQNPDKTDNHESLKTGQTKANAGPDEANTNADRKPFSKVISNANLNHADTHPAPVDVSCAISNEHSSIITSKGLLPINKLQVSTNFQSAHFHQFLLRSRVLRLN